MKHTPRFGLTLYELLVVMAILVTMAAIVIPLLTQTTNSAQLDATYATMTNVRNAIMGTGTQPGYFQDMKGLALAPTHPDAADPDAASGLPFLMCDLFVNPATTIYTGTTPSTPSFTATFDPYTKKGWRGPYLNSPSSESGTIGVVYDSRPPAPTEGLPSTPGSPILLQVPPTTEPALARPYEWRLVSVGPGSPLLTDPNAYPWDPALLTPVIYKNDLIVYLRADIYSSNVNLRGTVWTNYYDLKQKSPGP
jgi:type II secretory pathway pseudopilin PulG